MSHKTQRKGVCVSILNSCVRKISGDNKQKCMLGEEQDILGRYIYMLCITFIQRILLQREVPPTPSPLFPSHL